MKTRILGIVSIVCLGLFLAGCASIVGGTSQTVSINSNVKGANVIVNGATIGTTPYNGPLKRGKSTTVTLQKDGYETKTITLNTEIESIFWGNIIIGGVLGSTTDLSTGAMYKYAPATLQIDLDKAQAEKAGN
ncbi:MAG: PEGA domain-containing protein [Pseudobdellovibrionaceae bacterium]|nr:MAG: PEGA domain-containing protein [Pseudobdellovibrionaceae bacterium]